MGGSRSICAALLLALALAPVLLGGCGGDDGDPNENAHINHASGRSNGAIPDNREGTPPPPVKETNLKKLAPEASCRLFENFGEKDHSLLAPDAPQPKYESEPAVSGPHVEPPYQQADGAYRSSIRPMDYVASLDHGRMEIQYAPDLSKEIQLELKGLYDTMYGGTLLFPNEEMLYAVAVTTWRNWLVCTAWAGQESIDAIRAFGKAHWGKDGNESVKAFPVEGPTPAEAEE